MDFDQALEEIGDFGKFQILNYLLLCLPVFFSAGNSLTYVFTAGVPNYRCFVPGCDNDTNPTYQEPWLEYAIPTETEFDPNQDGYVPSQCMIYPRRNTTPWECSSYEFIQEPVRCDRWVYENDEWTILGEWNITCLENQWKLSLVGTVHFIGIMFGTLLFGFLADRYGRKKVFIFCNLLMSVTGIAQVLSSGYIPFQVFIFINALGTSGVYPLVFILGVEMVGPKKREMSGVVLNYFYAAGEAFVGVVSWLSKDWVTLQLAVSIPPSIFIIYYWLVPESVRWLLANKKNQKASIIIRKAARINGVKLSKELLRALDTGSLSSPKVDTDKPQTLGIWPSCKKLARSRTLRTRSLLLFYIWVANAFVYYGLSINSTSLGGNKYLNFIFVCLVEIPGYTMSWWAMNKLGRRWSLAVSFFLCGTTCVGAAFVPPDVTVAVTVLFLLGKLGITSAFGISYVYTTELYPTVMRSVGVGISSTMARFGAMLAPFVPLLSIYSKELPLLMFSGVSLLAGILVLFLPETLGTKLPDTVEEAKTLRLIKDSPQSTTDSTPTHSS